jgi:hypothetical protein
MRSRIYFLCLALAGCATDPPKGPVVPSAAVIAAAIQKVFAEAKLPGSPQVSIIRSALQPLPGDWIMCLQSSAPDQTTRYAMFFQNGQFLSFHAAGVADQCDEAAYLPPASPEPLATPDNRPRPVPERRKS